MSYKTISGFRIGDRVWLNREWSGDVGPAEVIDKGELGSTGEPVYECRVADGRVVTGLSDVELCRVQ